MGAIITTEEYDVEVLIPTSEYEYVQGQPFSALSKANRSWTMSYSLKDKSWTSHHSYMPNMYIYYHDTLYSWILNRSSLWRHNKEGVYANFYGVQYPFIIEYPVVAPAKEEVVWNEVKLVTYAKKFDPEYQEFVEDNFITFNKMIAYNSRQCTGLLNLVKKTQGNFFMLEQIRDTTGEIRIDKEEKSWHINDFRDIVVDYTKPLFRKDTPSLQSTYYIDKVLNNAILNPNKDWSELESFRDRYIVLRFIFDNFTDIKLITDFSEEVKSPIQ